MGFRTPFKSGANFYDEGVTPGVDPGSSFAFPLAGQSSVKFGAPLVELQQWKGDQRSSSVVLGKNAVAGQIPLYFDFLFHSRLAKNFYGAAGYLRPGGGATKTHRFANVSPGARGTFQYEQFMGETTGVYQRARYCAINTRTYNTSGQAAATQYTVDILGIGDIDSSRTTPLATPTDDGLVPTTYFNGAFWYNNVLAGTDLNSINLQVMGNVGLVPAAFNNGVDAGLAFGAIVPKGTLTLNVTQTGSNPGADLNAWNAANAGTEVPIECWWTDQPWTGSPNYYHRIVMPTCRLGKATFVPGGSSAQGQVITIQVPFVAARSNTPSVAASSFAGEYVSETFGPYVLPASCHLGIKPDGGATVDVTLGITGSQTAAAVAAALNGAGAFSAKFTAFVFANRLAIRSKQTGGFGASSSVQIDGTVANSAHTAIGLDTTARAGLTNCEIVEFFQTSLGSDLP